MPAHWGTDSQEEPTAELIINKSSSKDGGIGWSIRLIRQFEETDDVYLERCLQTHYLLEMRLRRSEVEGLIDAVIAKSKIKEEA